MMNHRNNPHDQMPVQSNTTANGAGCVTSPPVDALDAGLAVMGTDPGGYDPYNNAPPLPADKRAY